MSEPFAKVDVAISMAIKALSKVDTVLSKVQSLKTSILSNNTNHHNKITGTINTLVEHYDTEDKMVDTIMEK